MIVEDRHRRQHREDGAEDAGRVLDVADREADLALLRELAAPRRGRRGSRRRQMRSFETPLIRFSTRPAMRAADTGSPAAGSAAAGSCATMLTATKTNVSADRDQGERGVVGQHLDDVEQPADSEPRIAATPAPAISSWIWSMPLARSDEIAGGVLAEEVHRQVEQAIPDRGLDAVLHPRLDADRRHALDELEERRWRAPTASARRRRRSACRGRPAASPRRRSCR